MMQRVRDWICGFYYADLKVGGRKGRQREEEKGGGGVGQWGMEIPVTQKEVRYLA